MAFSLLGVTDYGGMLDVIKITSVVVRQYSDLIIETANVASRDPQSIHFLQI